MSGGSRYVDLVDTPPGDPSVRPAATDRRIPFDVVFNVRDLGGLRTSSGGFTRRGVLYRGDGVQRLAGADLDRARALRLETVIDLRTLGEIERSGRFPIEDYPLRWYSLPILERMWSDDDLAPTTGAVDFLRDRYLAMLDEGVRSLAQIVEIVAEGSTVLFHCAAGKDRTGVTAAVLLGLLEVPAAEIIDDYHATAGAMAAFVDWLSSTRPEAIDAMTSQPPEYLEAPAAAMAGFLQAVDERFGSMEGYVTGIGVPAATIEQLRAALVV